jgi:hypothetical protein
MDMVSIGWKEIAIMVVVAIAIAAIVRTRGRP